MTGHMDRDTYAAALVPIAVRLVGTVHYEGVAATRAVLNHLHAIPAPPGIHPVEALCVVLAAMVDDSRTPGELLAWTEPASDGTGPADPHQVAELVQQVCPPRRHTQAAGLYWPDTEADQPRPLSPPAPLADAPPADPVQHPLGRPEEVA